MAETPTLLTPTVAIVGGGPAGLSAAAHLAGRAGGPVVVLEREREAGGIPRHADHPGYGLRDRRRVLSGPDYARALVRDALSAGATIMTQTTVTGWADEATLAATGPGGRLLVRPEVFLFATGARERPRPARMIPGDRPAGVYTTGQLQNLVHLHHARVGTRAVVVGAELVSWSAVLTLRQAGCATEALVSRYPTGESYWAFRAPGTLAFRTRVVTDSQVVALHGRPRLSGVEIEHLPTGERSILPCDTVVFTGDWVADNELLRSAGVEIDPASSAPVVDTGLRTSRPDVFAVGNLTHPVETADVVALEGRFVADRIVARLQHGPGPVGGVPVRAGAPLRWISPGRVGPRSGPPARRRFVAWVDRFVASPIVCVSQDGTTLARRRLPWPAAPGRAFRIPAGLLADVDPHGGEVSVWLE
ncbi:MAG: FAD-dependent oxidoreductase [Propionibacteriaceae bacterium]|nr:FAD-dependent oxidoreductase [Propionibacteriaceae bacterium]